MTNIKDSDKSLPEQMSLEDELKRVLERRFLNNFCGLLPGGYRRAPMYASTLEEDAPELHEGLLQQFSLIDQVISELGLDPKEVERENNAQGDLDTSSIGISDLALRNQLIAQAKTVKEIFFDRYEYPIYERLRKNHPNVKGWTI